MARFLLRRLAIFPFVLLLANFLSFAYAHFALPRSIANNPFNFSLETTAAPLMPAYFTYLLGALLGDLGDIPGGLLTVGEALRQAIGASLGLFGITLGLSILAGVGLGIQAARSDPPGIARWLTLTATIGLAMPSFYIGMLFIVGLILYSVNSEAVTGLPLPLQGFGWDSHLILPALALTARPTMEIAQMTSNLMAHEFGKQYIVAARSLGNSWRTVRWRHVFRNVLGPVTVTMGRSFRLLVGELILVEYLFSWPGLGRLLAISLAPAPLTFGGTSATYLYPPVVASVVTLIAALFLIADLATTALLQSFDPRMRAAPEEAKRG